MILHTLITFLWVTRIVGSVRCTLIAFVFAFAAVIRILIASFSTVWVILITSFIVIVGIGVILCMVISFLRVTVISLCFYGWVIKTFFVDVSAGGFAVVVGCFRVFGGMFQLISP